MKYIFLYNTFPIIILYNVNYCILKVIRGQIRVIHILGQIGLLSKWKYNRTAMLLRNISLELLYTGYFLHRHNITGTLL